MNWKQRRSDIGAEGIQRMAEEKSDPLAGEWEGRLESSSNGRGGALTCTAVLDGQDRWKITFVSQHCGLGHRNEKVVLF